MLAFHAMELAPDGWANGPPSVCLVRNAPAEETEVVIGCYWVISQGYLHADPWRVSPTIASCDDFKDWEP